MRYPPRPQVSWTNLRNRSLLSVSLSSFVVLTVCGCQESQERVPAVPHQDVSRLDVLSETKLGKLWLSDRHVYKVVVGNPSRNPVTVVHMSASCGCTAIEPSRFNLASGTQQSIELTINLSNSGHWPPKLEESIDIELRALFDDGASQRITVAGIALRPFVVNDDDLHFEDPLAPGGEPQSFEIEFTAHPHLKSLSAETRDPLMQVSSAILDRDLGTATILLRRQPGNRLGRFLSHLTVFSETDDGVAQLPVRLKVAGKVETNFDWSPKEILLNTVTSAFAEEQVIISSHSATKPHIQAIECSDPRIMIHECSRLESLSSSKFATTISVKADPDATFDAVEAASIVINVREENQPDAVSILIPVSIVATRPAATENRESGD